MKIKGRVWIFGDEINTDLISPNTAFRLTPEEQVKLVFSSNRPGWAELVTPGDILIAGKNFGTGSSRPGAVQLRRLGLGGMAAESCNDLFFRNSVSY
ncbi:MAG: 3-isopropylmalate dehydratase, partial [Oscillospiraceae bacterium]|nr:3-isopropylmalate dehydratase [Oscillospiraceae bacterium]